MSWLKNAVHQSNTPKNSVIGILRAHLGGTQKQRSPETIHASDITKDTFCPRQWALNDLLGIKPGSSPLSTAMDATFQIGTMTEQLIMEQWGGQFVYGNWECRKCRDYRTMCRKPQEGFCKDDKRHDWRYDQIRVEAPAYTVAGGIDGLFDVGNPRLVIVETKILNTEDFDKIVIPLPEHRLRTNLYMKLVEESDWVYKDRINTSEARVLYVSRGYGRLNPAWNEVLPFKEFTIHRDTPVLVPMLKRAKALKAYRETGGLPQGICATATDKIAKNCGRCSECFSGKYPATVSILQQAV